MVHARRIGDRTLTFLVSGKLWRNSLVMMDRETGSLWSHITGECLEGEFAGQKLEQLPSVQTTWRQWADAHPRTRALAKTESVESSRYQRYFDSPDRIGILPMTWYEGGLPGKTLIQGLLVDGVPFAVVDSLVSVGADLDLSVGEVPVTIRRDPDGGVRAARLDDGRELLVRLAYWFAWSAYFPETGVFPAPARPE